MPALRRTVPLAMAAMAAFSAPAHTDSDPEAVIEYRQHVMNSLNAHAAAIGQMLSGAIPKDDLPKHLEAVALSASLAVKAFQPTVPGGDAKPEVWSKREDFNKRMTAFATNAEAAAKLAREKGKDVPETAVMDALSCKGCHDVYKTKK